MGRETDGPLIGKLYRACDYPDHGVDWDRPGIGAWWVVAEDGDDLVGAVQVIVAQPFGYLGDLLVAPAYRGRGPEGRGRLGMRPGDLAYRLLVTASICLDHAGSQVMMGIVSDELTGFQKMATRYGFTDLGRFRLYGRRPW